MTALATCARTGARHQESGLTLIEVLFAGLLFSLLAGASLQLVLPLSGTFQAETERADLQQRLRVATDLIEQMLRPAGAGSLVGASRGPLGRWMATVFPYRTGVTDDDPNVGVWFRPDVVSVLHMPLTAAQAVLRDGAGVGATFLTMTWPGSCPPPGSVSVCGFSPGTQAVLSDARGRWDLLTVAAVSGNSVVLAGSAGLSHAYAPGAVLSEITVRSLALRVNAEGISQLTQWDGFGPEFPAVEHVEALAFEYFGEPRPPERLTDVLLDAPVGPWTTYGPAPPPVTVDTPDDSWPAGENCVFAVDAGAHVPRLPALGGGQGLVPLSAAMLTDGPWCPGAGSRAYDADLLRIRRIRVRVRVQVASEGLRGQAGLLFSRGGSSTRADRFVPDQQIDVDVAPPNLSFGR